MFLYIEMDLHKEMTRNKKIDKENIPNWEVILHKILRYKGGIKFNKKMKDHRGPAGNQEMDHNKLIDHNKGMNDHKVIDHNEDLDHNKRMNHSLKRDHIKERDKNKEVDRKEGRKFNRAMD